MRKHDLTVINAGDLNVVDRMTSICGFHTLSSANSEYVNGARCCFNLINL